jgi:hypothetical protein
MRARYDGLTAKRLHQVLRYDPATGIFTWRVNKFANQAGGNAHKGTAAGTVNNGYRRIKIDGVIYRAARLAVLWMTGAFPTNYVDHHNLDRADDRWSNLRQATRSQDRANSPAQKGKRVPLKGVTWDDDKQKYYAGIRVRNMRIYLGRFDHAKDAHAAYVAAARRYFGEFARDK